MPSDEFKAAEVAGAAKPKAAAAKPKAAANAFEVELKHLPAYVVVAESAEAAGQLYLDRHGITATEHTLRVTPLDDAADSDAAPLPD